MGHVLSRLAHARRRCVDPHPGAGRGRPFNPVVDVWKADDWFHWGAFRAVYAFDFIYAHGVAQGPVTSVPLRKRDLYRWVLSRGNLAEASEQLDDRHRDVGGSWSSELRPFWKRRPPTTGSPAPKRLVPTLHVHGFWDQEDIYGAPPSTPRSRPTTRPTTRTSSRRPLVSRPALGRRHPLGRSCSTKTPRAIPRETCCAVPAEFLKGDAVAAPAPATVFETGTNRWRQFDHWPPRAETRRLYLQPGGGLAFTPPPGGTPSTSTSRTRPSRSPTRRARIGASTTKTRAVRPGGAGWSKISASWTAGPTWRPGWARRSPNRSRSAARSWPAFSPRPRAGRGLGGQADRRLSGRRPGAPPEMPGFERMVSADIFRGRYRESLEAPRPLAPAGRSLHLPLPHANHTLQARAPAHGAGPEHLVPALRPQPADVRAVDHDGAADSYRAARHRVHHGTEHATHLELPVEAKTGRR